MERKEKLKLLLKSDKESLAGLKQRVKDEKDPLILEEISNAILVINDKIEKLEKTIKEE